MRISFLDWIRLSTSGGQRWLVAAVVLPATLVGGLHAAEPANADGAGNREPVVELPAPDRDAGIPLMQALSLRRTIREFRTNALPADVLGGLLWAAFGINRPETGGRTAPSAMNAQEIDLYVATADGVFVYDAGRHALRRQSSKDIRAMTGGGAFAAVAPVTLIYVADESRQERARAEDRKFYAAITTGGVMQNVSLYAASNGLATVVHELDRGPLGDALELPPGRHIVLAQAVGYPAADPTQ